MIQSLLANFDSFWLILSQVPGALQAAINIYERNPALAVFAFVGVFLGCVAKQLVGGGDDFEIYDYRQTASSAPSSNDDVHTWLFPRVKPSGSRTSVLSSLTVFTTTSFFRRFS